MKKVFLFVTVAAVAVLAAACGCNDCPHVTPQDPDDVTSGPYKVKYRLYFGDAATAPVEGTANVYLESREAANPDVYMSFVAWGGMPDGVEYVSILGSGPLKLAGSPGNYSVAGRSEASMVDLYKVGEHRLSYYNVDVSVSGTIVRHARAATRCSPVMQTPDMYHDIALTVEAIVDTATDGAEPSPRTVRLEIFQ
jgi:hypothetical protein